MLEKVFEGAELVFLCQVAFTPTRATQPRRAGVFYEIGKGLIA